MLNQQNAIRNHLVALYSTLTLIKKAFTLIITSYQINSKHKTIIFYSHHKQYVFWYVIIYFNNLTKKIIICRKIVKFDKLNHLLLKCLIQNKNILNIKCKK